MNILDIQSCTKQNQLTEKITKRQGLPCKNRSVDHEIWVWRNSLIKVRGGKLVTKTEVQKYAREVYNRAGIFNFKASDGWYRRWLRRNSSEYFISNEKQANKRKVPQTEEHYNKKEIDDNCQHRKYPDNLNKLIENAKDTIRNENTQNLDTICEVINHPILKSESIISSEMKQLYNSEEIQSKAILKSEYKKHTLQNEKDNALLLNDSLIKNIFHKSIVEDKSKANLINNEISTECCIHKISAKSNQEKSTRNWYDSDKEIVNSVRRKGERYLNHFKTKVIIYASENTIKKAALKFHVNRSTISEWIKEKDKSEIKFYNRLLIPDEMKPADSVFYEWLEINKETLSPEIIIKKTLELFEKYGENELKKSCPWFLAYIKRLNEFDKSCKKKYIIYPEQFKIYVVNYAQQFSQLAASRLFMIARKRVFEWLGQIRKTGSINSKGSVNPSSYVTDPDVDCQIYSWYKKQPVIPSSKQIREKGRTLYKKAGYNLTCSHGWYYRWRSRMGLHTASSVIVKHDSLILEWILTKLDRNENISHKDILNEFSKLRENSSDHKSKPSLGWALRFCKRYPDLLQTIPDVTIPLPAQMESKVDTFKNNFLCCVKDRHIHSERIVSMDEIPLHFFLTGINKRPLLVRKPGFDTCHGSLIVSSLGNGVLLPYMLILKGTAQMIPDHRDLNNFVIITEKGIMDEDIMCIWLEKVLIARVGGKGLLICDCYEPHVCNPVMEVLNVNNIQQAVIPSGCSSRLQPLNSITKTLKYKIEQFWNELIKPERWVDDTDHLKSPSFVQIMDWVYKSYNSVNITEKENIKIAFHQVFSLGNESCTNN
uniref:HTH CENPB-type domain-containing protein n=1 Tax=Clastoptera arizonana TaxID=38151 RepID=A0A1B6CTX6_9HEMI